MYRQFAKKILDQTFKAGESIPLFKYEQEESHCLEMKFTLVCKQRKNISQFLYTMVSRWLIPGKQLDVSAEFAICCDEYAVCEMVINFENSRDLIRAKHNFPFLKREILIGAPSHYHATKILEVKGLDQDDKTALIQEKMAGLIHRFPKMYDFDMFEEMQHFLISSKEEFKAIRRISDLSRIVSTLYSFRKTIERMIGKSPNHRHISIKYKTILLHTPFGLKEVLSVFVGLNFLKGHELFEERHFLSALSQFIPGIQSIPGSYYAGEGDEAIQTFYIEVEKDTQKPFSAPDLRVLRKGVSNEIKNRIEQLVPPVFMPRNEEEVMRNILILSEQLRYLKDIPQMTISFDEQTDMELCFTVILVRIVHENSLPIKELFQASSLVENISVERVKMVGRLRRKYPKEACVLRVCLSSKIFLRDDYSVDFLGARIHLVKEIEEVIGDVRDYNGGMISKQSENFTLLKKELGSTAKKHALLLQNFFHSIFPVHFSSTLDPKMLKVSFLMLIGALQNSRESTLLISKKSNDTLFVMTKFQDWSFKQKILKQIEGLKLSSRDLLTIEIQIFDSFYLGFIYLNPEKKDQKEFIEKIPGALTPLTLSANSSY